MLLTIAQLWRLRYHQRYPSSRYCTTVDTLFFPYILGILRIGSSKTAALAAYPLDRMRRRMIMTSGEAVRYRSFIDAGRKIVAKEGAKALFGGAGANLLRAG